jgi:hypothetical protein
MFDNTDIPFTEINQVNWKQYDSYHPDVRFKTAYGKEEIYIKFYVSEQCVKADYGYDFGSAPYTDSCCEFFIDPAGDGIYYNMELNCIAKGTFSGGIPGPDRKHFGNDVISQIRRYSSLGSEPFGTKTSEGKPFTYSITIALPIKLFSLSNVKPLKGRKVRANFYKCGDGMPEKHYLSWNPIDCPAPNFHTPAFFGTLYFE